MGLKMGLVNLMFREMRRKQNTAAILKDPEPYLAELTEKNRARSKAPEALPAGLRAEQVPLPTGGCGCLVTGENDPQAPLLFYIHGGGFIGDSTAERMPFVQHAVQRWGMDVFSVDYRLAPEFRAPAARTDCLAAYEYVLKRFPGREIVFFGESAGGNLVLTVALAAKAAGLPLPACIIANSPIAQAETYTDSWVRNDKKDNVVYHGALELIGLTYCGKGSLRDPLVWPLYGDFRGFPPTLLEVSDSESLYDDSLALREKLEAAGADCTLAVRHHLMHAYMISPTLPEVTRPLAEALTFIRSRTVQHG